MPHAHRGRRSSSFATTDVIESTIERLLSQGARISEALENEVQYAEKQYGEATPKRDCRGSTASESAASTPEPSSKAASTPVPSSSKAASSSSSKANSATSATSNRTWSSKSSRAHKKASSVFHHRAGVPGWPPAPPSDLSHTYDLDDVPSLPGSVSSFTSVSGMSYTSRGSSRALSRARRISASSLTDENREDITSDMLEPPASSVMTAILKTTVNDAMPKPNDVFLGMKHFPCYVRDGETTHERSARVTMHRRVESQWVVLCVDVDGPNKEKIVILRCEVLGRLVRNVFINGNRAD